MTFLLPILLLLSIAMTPAYGANVTPSASPEVMFEFGRAPKDCFGNRVFIDPKQSTLFVSYMQNNFSGWDAVKGRQVFSWSTENLNLWPIYDAAFLSNDSQMLLAGSNGISQVNLWDGSELASYDKSSADHDAYYAIGVRDDEKIAAATSLPASIFSVPNPMALTFGTPSTYRDAFLEQPQKVMLIDLEHKKILGSLTFQDTFVRSVKFSKNHRFVITTSYTRLRFWDVSDPLNVSLTKEINVKDLIARKTTPLEPIARPFTPSAEILLSVATSSDLRLTAVATPNDIFVIDNESALVIPELRWKQAPRMAKVNYLVWSASGQEIMGSNLEGQIFVWSINDPTRSYVGSYNNPGGIAISLNPEYGHQPYVAFAIDPLRRYFIRPGREENSEGCSGFEVTKMPNTLPAK